ncbi:hypothetical protein LF1_10570 [Rubripirellula obstinata]|uniref:Uncharacterized protein n=1 Tax=Rubripirellula obstinata TaxID=406547 RepID=A0A5B1CBP9_9BACT|nr:hypothetical protein LF1_10570 [Rubripirellula obstinata]
MRLETRSETQQMTSLLGERHHPPPPRGGVGGVQRRDGYLNRLTAWASPRAFGYSTTRGAMPTRLNELTRILLDQNSSRRCVGSLEKYALDAAHTETYMVPFTEKCPDYETIHPQWRCPAKPKSLATSHRDLRHLDPKRHRC